MLTSLRDLLRHPNRLLITSIFLVGLIYVGKNWSPSSYAFTLGELGVTDTGLVLGQPQGAVRSDEYWVYTPLQQVAVNNNFERYNATSPFHEDLRSFHVLPLRDWAIVFKPTLWPFHLASPAFAFSFNHFSLMALFVIGYALFFQRLKLNPWHSIGLAGLLFCSAHTQFFWTTYGPSFALFPWVCLAASQNTWPLWLRAAAVYYTTASWLINHFYPPVFVSLSFVGIALLFGHKLLDLRLRSLAVLGAAGAAGAATCVLYLWDFYQALLPTVFPGQRRMAGGMVGHWYLLEQLWPYAFINNNEPLIPTNLCEMSAVGTCYGLAAACFIYWQRGTWTSQFKRCIPALVALAMMSAWQYLPVPMWMGKPLLWHFVPGTRMLFATGMLWLLIFSQAASQGFKVTPVRTAIFVTLVAGGWVVLKQPHIQWAQSDYWKDFAIIPPVLIVLLAQRLTRPWSSHTSHAAIMASCLAVAVATFGLWNPIQSARPIFNRQQSAFTRALALLQDEQGGTLSAIGPRGMVLNGYGFRSIAHTQVVPHLDFFARMFPDMPSEKRDWVFNRYGHVMFSAQTEPPYVHPGDVQAIYLPGPTQCRTDANKWTTANRPDLSDWTEVGQDGYLDALEESNGVVTLRGWSNILSDDSLRTLAVVRNGDITNATVLSKIRLDVVRGKGNERLLCSGFDFQGEVTGHSDFTCVALLDASTKRYTLLGRNSEQVELCREHVRPPRAVL